MELLWKVLGTVAGWVTFCGCSVGASGVYRRLVLSK